MVRAMRVIGKTGTLTVSEPWLSKTAVDTKEIGVRVNIMGRVFMQHPQEQNMMVIGFKVNIMESEHFHGLMVAFTEESGGIVGKTVKENSQGLTVLCTKESGQTENIMVEENLLHLKENLILDFLKMASLLAES
jgi:hypothetical protein